VLTFQRYATSARWGYDLLTMWRILCFDYI
jgi:hypothetical protein